MVLLLTTRRIVSVGVGVTADGGYTLPADEDGDTIPYKTADDDLTEATNNTGEMDAWSQYRKTQYEYEYQVSNIPDSNANSECYCC